MLSIQQERLTSVVDLSISAYLPPSPSNKKKNNDKESEAISPETSGSHCCGCGGRKKTSRKCHQSSHCNCRKDKQACTNCRCANCENTPAQFLARQKKRELKAVSSKKKPNEDETDSTKRNTRSQKNKKQEKEEGEQDKGTNVTIEQNVTEPPKRKHQDQGPNDVVIHQNVINEPSKKKQNSIENNEEKGGKDVTIHPKNVINESPRKKRKSIEHGHQTQLHPNESEDHSFVTPSSYISDDSREYVDMKVCYEIMSKCLI